MNRDKTRPKDERLPVSRRTFLAGIGTLAAASAAQGRLETLGGFPAAPHLPAGALHFSEVFAPAEGWVRPAEQPWRQEICLNGAWRFQPVALAEGFVEGRDPAPVLPVPSAERWEETPVQVPSPWNVNSFADHHGQGGDFRCYPDYPQAWETIRMGWLRRSVRVPASWKGKRIFLHFGAVAGNTEVLVNGKSVGSHFDIFLPFDLDVTDAIVPGGSNEVLVGVRKASLFDQRGPYGRRTYQGGSFWGQHIAGIWQDVFLVAMPPVHVANVFVQPLVDTDTLRIEVTVANAGDEPVEVTLTAQAFPWKSKAGNTPVTAPLPSSELESEPALELPVVQVKIPARGQAIAVLQGAVNRQLELWSSEHPNLYGLVVKVHHRESTIDSKYTRFGWRQITFRGPAVFLNGEPIILRGDSWHFLGIPQMTRRYAWAWFTALRHAGLNAVRLHAQPYPAFYLDMADEMGLLVLDETAVWASDGGPKLDDPAFWQDTERHLTALILRDRNHPSVFGWSVSNEVRPIVHGVMRNPPGMMDELLRHYTIWAELCRKNDPTRPWISADGEEDGDGRLPVYSVHYGGPEAMDRALASGKPWGVGEAGNAYYGTPVQVAETNGARAYESFEGRMEGVAISSYQSLIDQRNHHAIYRSVFNLVWYGLQPLALGMKDVTRPPALEDGVFFAPPVDGRPGVQPQRLGPYCTTLNPGYDTSLPMYRPWPLFEAIRDAAAEPPTAGQWSHAPQPAPPRQAADVQPINSVRVLAGDGSTLAVDLENLGVPAEALASNELPQLLVVDGQRPPGADAGDQIEQAFRRGATVLLWGVDSETASVLSWLPARLTVTDRAASSLLPGSHSLITDGLRPDNLYFCDQTPPVITQTGLGGPLIESGEALLKDCNTNWLLWNNQPEYAKTAMVLRSEREASPSGVVLAQRRVDAGSLLVTTLPIAPATLRAENVNRALLTNLGLSLRAGMDRGKPLLRTGALVRMLICGFFPQGSTPDPFASSQSTDFQPGSSFAGKLWQTVFAENGVFDFTRLSLTGSAENAEAWASFWVNSPRSLEDLLLEPNLPRVDFHVSQHDAAQIWLNGKTVLDTSNHTGNSVADSLRLRAGWNHLLLRLKQRSGRWDFTASFTASQDFLAQLDSSFTKP